MKTILATVLVFATLTGFNPVASGQDTVTYNAIDGATFSNLWVSAQWVAVLDTKNDYIQIGSDTASITLSGSYWDTVQLSVGSGTAGLTVILNAGIANIGGTTTSVSTGSSGSLSGIAIGIISPLQYMGSQYTMAVTNLIVNSSNHDAYVADTHSSSFAACLASFGQASSAYNIAFDAIDPVGVGNSKSQIVILGVGAEPVPEPSTLALLGSALGTLFILGLKKATGQL